MKRLFCFFSFLMVVLWSAGLVSGKVHITCTDLGNGFVKVSYDSSEEAYPIRALSLDIKVSEGKIVLLDNLSSDFWLYPGPIIIVAGEIMLHSSPICDTEDSPNGTLGGLGTSGVTIEMAAWYPPGGSPPPATGVLMDVMVSSACTFSVTPNTLRGGIISEEPATLDVNSLAIVVSQPTPTAGDYAGGTGIESDPYLISEPNHLNSIGLHPFDWHKYFKLIHDIDMKDYNECSFNIIGTEPAAPFLGVFDGNNHKIQNLTYVCPDSNFVGLFGAVDGKDSVVKNTAIIDPVINAPNGMYVASLIGYLGNGTVSSCSSQDGLVVGNLYTSGLIGWIRGGTVENCYSTTDVNAEHIIGGIAGSQGSADSQIISDCYSTGAVAVDANISGGFVGCCGGSITDSFYDTQTSGTSEGVGESEPCQIEVTGKTTAEMKTKATFTTAGWDFVGESGNGTEDIWTIREGVTYPVHAGQLAPGDFIGQLGVNFDDFAFFANRWRLTGCDDANHCDGADLDKLGSVDVNDLRIFTENWLVGK